MFPDLRVVKQPREGLFTVTFTDRTLRRPRQNKENAVRIPNRFIKAVYKYMVQFAYMDFHLDDLITSFDVDANPGVNEDSLLLWQPHG
jgi:hypothetical protein